MLRCVLALLFVPCALVRPVAAAIDANIDLTVWRMLYGVGDIQGSGSSFAGSSWLAQDKDGDGMINDAERVAGTNPFNPASSFGASANPAGNHAASITFSSIVGKIYSLEASTDISNPANWTPLSLQLVGNGSLLTFNPPPVEPGTNLFYRVTVQDMDTDGDQVSDWAEKITGFDAASGNTHGAPEGDHDALANDLLQENVITVRAIKSTATQPSDAATLATDTATITITRGGTLRFSTITVPLSVTGTAVAGVDFASLPSFITFPPKVGSITLTITPLANAGQKASSTVTVSALPGGGYTLGAGVSASAVIYPSDKPAGTGLWALYYNSTAANVSPYNPASLFNGTPALQRTDATVDYTWGASAATSPAVGVNSTNFGVQWTGQVQPQYSETYYFDVVSDDGVKLWVNGQLIIDSWKYVSGDRIASITLQAGVLYDIKLQYYQATGGDQIHLYWYSESQPKQVIPAARLYPGTASYIPAPPAITSAPVAIGFVGQSFTFNVTASVSGGNPATFALGIGSGPLPPGLSLNPNTGLISGTPSVAGIYQVALTATNAYRSGASVLEIQILNAGSGVTREIWNGLSGPSVADLPSALAASPQSPDNALATLEDATSYEDNTGERLRGYFVAPTTGKYYFWLAASNVAELWISDDAEPVNLVRRSWITAPGTTPRNWSDGAQPRQRSPWLNLVAGQRYYYEVLHNTGPSGAASHVSVSYLLDPTGTATTPVAGAAPVPSHLLSRYDYPTTTGAAGELYGTNLSPQGSAVSAATGSANLRLLPGNSQAILHFNYSGLSSPRTAYHIHISPDNTGSGPIIFDLDDVDKFHPELITEDGGYIWDITDVGAYTASQIVSALQKGTTYFNVHTVNYPNGEIRGFLTLVNGSQKAPVLAADPGFSDDHSTDAGAARFLNQAAYGASPSDIAAVKAGGYSTWITDQMSLTPATRLLPDVLTQASRMTNNPLNSYLVDNAWWRAAVTAPDQLRQRVAFALSEILVVSDTSAALGNRADALASYYDTLADYAFLNYRDLLKAVTLHPTMGYWLNMQGNALGNLVTGYHPNENYAREIMQLFSIGLNRLWPDGSLVLDSQGDLVPTYNQGVITNGFARVFTGWNWNQPLQASGQLPQSFSPTTNFLAPMVMVKKYHEVGTKTLLNNVVLPAAVGYNPLGSPVAGSQADSDTAAYDLYGAQDLEKAIDNIFYHPNVGPYICRQLIQRLVHSNPSPTYLHRVVQVFNDDGSANHIRGNLAAVIRAILIDGEARDASLVSASLSAGKQREPLLRIAGPARTFPMTVNPGTYSQSGTGVMTITTTQPHRFIVNDVVSLDFTGNAIGTPPVAPTNNPSTAGYTVLTTPSATTFTVNAQGMSSANYAQTANTNVLTVNLAGPPVGGKVYLKFVTGGLADGIYTVASIPSASQFTVIMPDPMPTANLAGSVIVPKTTGYYTTTNPTASTASTITVATTANTGLAGDDHIWLQTNLATLGDADRAVASMLDERHFTLANTVVSKSETDIVATIYPLVPPPITRSGNVTLGASKFDMQNTNGQLNQTPLNASTVFNYFYPDYQYPGSLATNHVTTPEFQILTDSNIITLTNTISSTILSSSNSNGLSNFKNGSVNLDLGSYMTAPYVSVSSSTVTNGNTVTRTTTTLVDSTLLVNKLSDILTGGMLTQAAKNTITSFLSSTTSFPITTTTSGTVAAPPAAPTLPTTAARDKVRAAVQLILVSPEYAIQK